MAVDHTWSPPAGAPRAAAGDDDFWAEAKPKRGRRRSRDVPDMTDLGPAVTDAPEALPGPPGPPPGRRDRRGGPPEPPPRRGAGRRRPAPADLPFDAREPIEPPMGRRRGGPPSDPPPIDAREPFDLAPPAEPPLRSLDAPPDPAIPGPPPLDEFDSPRRRRGAPPPDPGMPGPPPRDEFDSPRRRRSASPEPPPRGAGRRRAPGPPDLAPLAPLAASGPGPAGGQVVIPPPDQLGPAPDLGPDPVPPPPSLGGAPAPVLGSRAPSARRGGPPVPAAAAPTGPPARRPAAARPVPGRTGRRPSGSRPASRTPAKSQWARLAPVYDVDGPRIRLGVAWFLVALPAIVMSTMTTALLYGVVAAFAARQTVTAWKGQQWQADAAAGIAALPVLAGLLGTNAAVAVLVLAAGAAVFVGLNAPSAGLSGGVGRVASAGIMLQSTMPVALAGVSMVIVRRELIAAATILFVLACVYEMGDFLIGSGSSNSVEGPLAGAAALVVTGFPLALLLIEPFDVLGVGMLGVFAICCPVGQWIASAVLPSPGAHAPALRRMDTLLLLAPLWAIAAGAVVLG